MKTVAEVLDTLVAEGLISEEESSLKNSPDSESPSPWFIQALMGLGGWLGAIFFFSFISSCFFITMNLSGEFAIGIAFSIMGAVCLLATTSHINAAVSPNLFTAQFRLVVHIVGHVALIGGVFVGLQLWRLENYAAVLGLLISVQTAFFVWLYPDGIFRFLGSIAFVFGLNLIVYDFAIVGSLSVLVGGLGLLLFYLFSGIMPAKQELEHFELLQSLPYGLTFGFFGTILHELAYGYYAWEESLFGLYQPYMSSIILLALLLWMIVRLLSSYQISITAPNALFILGLVILIALPTLNTPGIVGGILVVLLAFRRHNWILMGLAYAFLAYFIIYFYYTLNLTLDVKSYILMGTGLALLLGRLLLKRVLPDIENTEAA